MRNSQRRNSRPDAMDPIPDLPAVDRPQAVDAAGDTASLVGNEDVPDSSDSTTSLTPMSRQTTVKPATYEDLRPSHQHGYHYPHHSASGSRLSSAKTSSSSLQALNEDVVTDARSDNSSIMRNPLVQKVAQHFDQPVEPLAPSTQSVNTSGDFPVYPDQSYAVLQSQVHPSPYPFLRSRSSYPVHSDISARYPNGRGARTAGNTPISSPGLFSSRSPRSTPPYASDDESRLGSPYLHPTHLQPPKETHTVEVDRDANTGNKLINEYEILEELGRGEHGKVKLGRHVVTKQEVAIKIVQRYSKRRRLGKLGNPEDKVKKEVAILKKARHPNVVSLLEVIDDPNRQKVYIVLEYVENGEIVWRKKGLREIVNVDKRRLEREKKGIPDSPSFVEESLQYVRASQLQRRQRERARERRNARTLALQEQSIPAWSLEHGGESDEEADPELPRTSSRTILNEDHSAHSSPSHSYDSTSELDRRMREASLAAIEGSMYGPYASDYYYGRRFSTASSNIGYASSEPDWLSDDDDLSYVPCLTMSEARNAFRDSVLGLEYLHYQGIIHRDIKPANLLVTANHRVKISDFGVSYLGRPMRDDEEEQVTETDASELDDARELSKTVGTPAFYAPELCYTGDDFVNAIGNVPKITGAIDVWSLGVTLYGMIFGRLPFVSDDEFSMFQTIVKKEVFIPRKRLKAVEENASSADPIDRNRVMNCNKRMEDELVYEDIDDELYDLLKRLLTKDPTKRITLKEIKHHPWVLRGLQNPRAWVEETDPGYQSKGKRIEVSTEEVTTAVSKVPFIQRVRSNVAKWSGYITGRSREGRKRATSNAASADSAASTSSSGSLWRDWSQGRRQSLRGDEESSRLSRFSRESDHPLSQSVTASPDPQEDEVSYHPISRTNTATSADRTPRPPPPQRATSSLSSTESTKTVRAFDPENSPSLQPRASTPSFTESLGSTSISGIFSGAGRRLAKGFQTGEWRPERSRSVGRASVDGDARSEPSLALSVASARGEVQATDARRDETSHSVHQAASSRSLHRRNKSHQLAYGSSVESFQLAEVLLRQKVQDGERRADTDRSVSRRGSEAYSADFRAESEEVPRKKSDSSQDDRAECGTSQDSNGGLTTSPPSATTIASSVDDYNSGISQSASHRSIPSVLSRASSLSGDMFPVKEKEAEGSGYVPAILRTGDTVKAIDMSYQRSHEDDESRYYCDDEEDDSEDEGIVFGKKTSARPDIKINK